MGGRGRRHLEKERKEMIELVDKARTDGARQKKACDLLGISHRSLERWRTTDGGQDGRKGPLTSPANKLSEMERMYLLKTVNCKAYRDLSPNQIVPLLADKGIYIASESTVYRVLREEGQQSHREPSRPSANSHPGELSATGPNQVWTWDITYLPGAIRGTFYYLYMVMDVWSRVIVGWDLHDHESMELSSQMISRICIEKKIDENTLALHSDNGGPMKGSTMLATLEKLGIMASFSRPHVSDDNPFSEALFRTLKYRPEYPNKPFDSITDALSWVTGFVDWYNMKHLHSSIKFVTPYDRHEGNHEEILCQRTAVYEVAKNKNPNRWSGKTRNWEPTTRVVLNPKNRNGKAAA